MVAHTDKSTALKLYTTDPENSEKSIIQSFSNVNAAISDEDLLEVGSQMAALQKKASEGVYRCDTFRLLGQE